jgi:hypothetical protein
MKLTVNIGLNIDGGTLNVGHVAFAIESVGKITAIKLKNVTHEKGVEPTLIVDLDADHDNYKRLLHVSRILHQDCIAVYDNDAQLGTLIGDKADAWGAFNPMHFHFIGARP